MCVNQFYKIQKTNIWSILLIPLLPSLLILKQSLDIFQYGIPIYQIDLYFCRSQ